MQKIITRESNLITIKTAFKAVFKNSIFIAFSFVNLFTPFFATMMAALNGPNGAINVIGVGLATSFVTIFNQFLFLISMITFYILNRDRDLKIECNYDFYAIWIILLIYAIAAAILFVATSFLYIYFSSIYKNIFIAVNAGYNYIAILIPSLFFNTYIYLHLFRTRNIHKWYGYAVLFSLFAMNLIFIPVIGILPNWSDDLKTLGIGLGITTSSFVMFSCIVIFNFKKYVHSFYFDKNRLLFILNKTKNFCLVFLLSTILKSILVMGIAISLNLSNKESPPALMITKIIWYNSLFFCGWFADGLMYSIQYTRLSTNSYDQKPNYKIWNMFILLSTVGTLIICVIFSYICMLLPKLYISHQDIEIFNPLNQPNGLWPYGNLSVAEIRDYLWDPYEGIANFNLAPIITANGIKWQYSKTFALLYMTLYHVIVNTTKIMGISEIKFNQKFNWKSLISNFILISLIMVFIILFSVVGSDESNVIKATFPGIDAFSFSLLIIISFLFLLTILSYLKAMNQQTKLNKLQQKFNTQNYLIDINILKNAISVIKINKLENIGYEQIPLMLEYLTKKQYISNKEPTFNWANIKK